MASSLPRKRPRTQEIDKNYQGYWLLSSENDARYTVSGSGTYRENVPCTRLCSNSCRQTLFHFDPDANRLFIVPYSLVGGGRFKVPILDELSRSVKSSEHAITRNTETSRNKPKDCASTSNAVTDTEAGTVTQMAGDKLADKSFDIAKEEDQGSIYTASSALTGTLDLNTSCPMREAPDCVSDAPSEAWKLSDRTKDVTERCTVETKTVTSAVSSVSTAAPRTSHDIRECITKHELTKSYTQAEDPKADRVVKGERPIRDTMNAGTIASVSTHSQEQSAVKLDNLEQINEDLGREIDRNDPTNSHTPMDCHAILDTAAKTRASETNKTRSCCKEDKAKHISAKKEEDMIESSEVPDTCVPVEDDDTKRQQSSGATKQLIKEDVFNHDSGTPIREVEKMPMRLPNKLLHPRLRPRRRRLSEIDR